MQMSLLMLFVHTVVFSAGMTLGSEPVNKRLNVAVAQPLVIPGNVAANIGNLKPLVAEAGKRGAELIVFSECALTGFDLKGVGFKAALSLEDPRLSEVAVLAREQGVVIVAGFHEKKGDTLHNTAGVFYPDGRRVIQRKHLIGAPERAMSPVVPGERKRTCFDVNGFRCALLICADDGMPGIYEELAVQGCDAVIIITAGAGSDSMGFHQAELTVPDRRKQYAKLASALVSPESIEKCLLLKQSMIACNQAGYDPAKGYFHPGYSSIINWTGEVTALIPIRFVFEHLRPDLAVGFITHPKP